MRPHVTIAAAGPSGAPAATWRDAPASGQGAGARTTAPPGRTVPARHREPPAGALPAAQALRELRAGKPAMDLDTSGAVRTVTAAPGRFIGTGTPVNLPGRPAYLHFAHSLLKGGGSQHIEVLLQADGGAWAVAQRLTTETDGYGSIRIDLGAYAGHGVRVRFRVNNPGNAALDWYLDDVRFYTCDDVTSAPREAYGYRSAEGIVLSWAAPLFAPSPYHWELTFDPPIPGAPATTSANLLTVPGAAPDTVYRVTVAARTEDGRAGVPVVVTVSTRAPVSCATVKPTQLLLGPFAKPMPLTDGHCLRPQIPHRR